MHDDVGEDLNSLFEIVPEASPTPSGASGIRYTYSDNESEVSAPKRKRKKPNESESLMKEHLAIFSAAVENNNVIGNKIVSLLENQQKNDTKMLDFLQKMLEKD